MKSGQAVFPFAPLFAFALALLISETSWAQEVPVFQWARRTVGGPGDDYGNGVTADASGNVFSTGEFTEAADFDPGAGVFTLTPVANSRDIFISKVDQNGNFQWAHSFGAGGLDAGKSVTTDAAGNVYVVGYSSGPIDFDPGGGVFTVSAGVFILKLDTDGNFVWAGTVSADNVAKISYASGFIYLTGYFEGSADFDPGPGTAFITIPNSLGNGDAFVLKLDLNGNYVWARNLGDPSDRTVASDIKVNASGEVITSGSFRATADFDPGAGTFFLTSAGNDDAFVSKLDANGNFVWAIRIGGTSTDAASGVGIDGSDRVTFGGTFAGTVDFDPGPGINNLTSAGSSDLFVVQVNSAGSFNWATRTGGSSDDRTNALAVDASGGIYSTGYFRGTVDFNPGAGINNLTSSGSQEIFVQKLDAGGNYVWATRTGSGSTDIAYDIHADNAGNVYVTSFFYGTADFDPTCGTANLSSAGSSDVFVQKLMVGFTPAISSFAPPGGAAGTPITITGTAFSPIPASNTVRFNGVLASVSASSATSISTTVPASASTGPITVRVGCYTGTSATNFIVPTPPPIITSFSPVSGPVGTSVIVTGTGFSTTTTNNVVFFGGMRAAVTGATLTQLTVTVPVGATYDPISVTVNGLTGYSKQPFLVTFPNGGLVNSCSFEPVVAIGSATQGYDVAVGDIDGDGKEDIAVPDNPGGVVRVYRNISTVGSLTAGSFAASVDLTSGTNPTFLEIVEIDGDGKLDLIVTNYNSNTLSVFRNTSTSGNISFAAKVDLATNGGPYQIATGDLNGDGRTDIAISNANSSGVSIWENVGNAGSITAASFAPKFDIPMSFQWVIAIKDLDLDGKVDLISGPALSTTLTIFRNIHASGSLSLTSFAPSVNFTVGTWPEFIAVGDLDNDGKPDMVTSSWPDAQISILRNTSTPGSITIGSFAPRIVFPTGSEPRGVDITDFDGDGRAEIALASQATNHVSIYKNQTSPGTINTGSFATPVDYPAGGNLRSVKGADFDGDGKPDLAVTSWGAPTLGVLRNDVLAMPTVTGFSPSSGPIGTTVTITGTNFSPTLSDNVVKFNNVTGYVTGATPTTLTAIVPATATTGLVSVTVNCNGPVNSATNFTVTPLSYNACAFVTLNGSSDYIEIGTTAALQPASITIEALVNFSAIPGFGVIVAKRDGTLIGNSYALWYDAGNLRAGVRLGPSIAAPWTPVVGQWYHVALTYNSVTNAEILYVDGAPIASGTSLPPIYTTDPVLIGADVNNGVHDGFFPGKIDEVRFWNTARTPTQLLTNLTSSLTGSESGLLAYYRIDETGQGPGIVVNNSGPTGAPYNGLTVGTATTPVFTSSCSCVPATERAALVALYNATDGVNWTTKTNWLNADESTWYGVTVTGCHVSSVMLDNNNLSGTIPPELVDLDELTNLSLAENQLYGVLPPEIFELDLLEVFDLHSNDLFGDIPPEIENMFSIQSIQLWDNQLSGGIPSEIDNLNTLEELNLSQNFLSGTIPGWGALPNLRYVNFSHNQLENDLPSSLGTHLAIEELYLNNNFLTDDIPQEIADLPALRILDVSNNQFDQMRAITSSVLTDLTVHHNNFDFGDLELNIGVANYSYDPQALLPPGGQVTFTPGGTLSIPFSTPGSANSYQWYEGTTAIPLATSPSLSRPGMTGADAGYYTVQVSSSVVTGTVLISRSYVVTSDPCSAGGPDGDNDPSFIPDIGGSDQGALGVELQSDGKIIVLAYGNVFSATNVDGVFRLNSNGTFDNTFSVYGYGNAILVQPDDKILVINNSELRRLNSDGTEDNPFNSNVPSFYNAYISAIALQPDGKILLSVSEDSSPFVLIRLNSDGTNDPSFSAPSDLEVNVIRVQPDGMILLGGYFTNGIMRLQPSGTPDVLFNENMVDGIVFDIAIQPDGKIIAAGGFVHYNDTETRNLVRIDANGNIDPSFESMGITDITELGSLIFRVQLEPSGKIILAGTFHEVSGTERPDIVRLNSDGTVDCAFDSKLGTNGYIGDAALQDNGHVLIAGYFEDYNGVTNSGFNRILNGGGATITISLQPTDASVCEGTTATFTMGATGTTNLTYQWQYSPDGVVPFVDISNGGFYSNVTTASLGVISDPYPEGYYLCKIDGDLAPTVYSNAARLISVARPAAPTTTGNSSCGTGSLMLTASGGVNGEYRWYTVATGGTALVGEVNSVYTTPVLSVTTTYYVSRHVATCESNSRTAVTATINSLPTAPGASGGSSCTSSSFTLTATGGVNGQYRWYTGSTGGVAVAGEVNSTYTTPVLTTTTTFYVSIHDGTCESLRTPATATISSLSAPAVITSNCTASGATLTGPAGFTTYTWSNGATTPSINVTIAGSYTLSVTDASGCNSPLSTPVVFTAAFCNQSPVLTPTTVTTTVQASVTVDVSAIVTDLDNNIDLSTLTIVAQPTSGALASIDASFNVVVDYSNTPFAGTDHLTIQVCDVLGACTQAVITIEVAGEITIFNALSPNGDGKNDTFFIEYINSLPATQQNKVTILNRWGTVVFEATNYDNTNVVFRGLSSGGDELPSGTYYYVLEFTAGAEKRTGFLSLRR